MSAAIPPGYDLNLIPAGVPPLGVIPTIGGGPYLGTATIVIESVMIFFAVLAVAFRMVAGWHSRRDSADGLSAADWTSFVAIIISIAQSAIVMTLHNYERHQWNVSVGMLTSSYFKRMFIQNFIAWPAIFLAKISILLMYLRLFRIKQSIRHAAFAGMLWTAMTYLPNMAVAGYWCSAHFGEQWDFNVGIRCGSKAPLKWLVTSAAMSVALDIYIFLLPIPVVLGLKLSGRKRLGLLFVFTTAFFAVICAVLTLVYRVKLLLSTDSMWLSSQLFICNGVENYIAIIVGALPGCSGYFKSHIKESAFFISISSRFTGSRGTSNQSSKERSKATKGAYKLREFSNDTESQKSLKPGVGEIGVKHSYEVRDDQL
ncbi:hypothetical protein K458DRAFT_422593 [Lentithecium fluviatile CBS 122367]|uniref:Rhodopsin domain-containing protein n=1 Tax=Lentithecium fluviatile CBS 122367 TaxID=1168545 RepID=A0A6G1IMF9_9PLEO|nr:hypothetical protein K458DRAFT_422593 [Lentithecium fluviatile CBS 122367]